MTADGAVGLSRGDYHLRCALLGLTPLDCAPIDRPAHLPAWLTAPLIATASAREKLRAWASTTSPDVTPAAADPDHVLLKLAAYGDAPFAQAIARTLCRLPPPVRDYAVRFGTYLGVGSTTAGWCGPRMPVNTPWVIVLSTALGRDEATLQGLIAHEAAHAWLMPEPGADVIMGSAFWAATVYESPIPDVAPSTFDTVMALRREYERDERQAEALCASWGFAPMGR